jgi:hypothetical protein
MLEFTINRGFAIQRKTRPDMIGRKTRKATWQLNRGFRGANGRARAAEHCQESRVVSDVTI